MKYELNEGQWVEFINSLPAAARANRDLADTNHKNSQNVLARNTISCSGSPLLCSSQRPARAAWLCKLDGLGRIPGLGCFTSNDRIRI